MQRAPVRRLPPLPRERPLDGRETFTPIELAPSIRAHLRRVEEGGQLQGRLHVIESWAKWTMPERVAFLRALVEDTARDPAIARKAISIVREARVPLRDHRGEWSALLRWVQRNIRFTAEPDERIQSPQYTLTERYGDCDDLGVCLAALAHSIRLPWKFVISGRDAEGNRVRWVEGERFPEGASWTHIYVLAGWPPFKPGAWAWAEPTLDVPLGTDAAMLDPAARARRADLAGPEAAPAASTWKVSWPTVFTTVLGSTLAAVLSYKVVSAVKRAERRGRRRR